jgi:hypothetical protein
MSGIWDWFDEFELEARRKGDQERTRLGSLHRDAYRFRESDPDRALKLYGEGRRLAGLLREPWWMLYYDQQTVHALLHFKQDYRNVLDLAVANVLEVRKPSYGAFPRRLLIHGDLVSAYLGIDPAGHADSIQQALDYLDRESPAERRGRRLQPALAGAGGRGRRPSAGGALPCVHLRCPGRGRLEARRPCGAG